MQGSTSAMATDVSKLVGLESAGPPLLPLLRQVDGGVHRLTEIREPLSGAPRAWGGWWSGSRPHGVSERPLSD